MRISDWSSDVCSSDLRDRPRRRARPWPAAPASRAAPDRPRRRYKGWSCPRRSCPRPAPGNRPVVAGRFGIVGVGLRRDRADACLAGGDRVGAVEDAQHRVVTALVAMIEPDQFAALAREGLAEDMVGRWLDAQRI